MIEQIALVVAGVVAPFVINLFKGNMTGKPAFALSVMTAVTISLGVKVLLPPALGGLPSTIDPADALGAIGQVFSIATIIYKVFLEKKGGS